MDGKMNFEELERKVLYWSQERRIIPNATPVSQLLKAVSEMGELCDAEGKKDRKASEDAEKSLPTNRCRWTIAELGDAAAMRRQ